MPTARNPGCNQLVAVERHEDAGEGRRAEQDDEYHRRCLCGVDQRIVQHLPAELLVEDGEDEREQRAYACRLGRSRPAGEDGTEHADDQDDRRDQVDERSRLMRSLSGMAASSSVVIAGP